MVYIREQIASAETPPGMAYFDPGLFEAEMETIFTSAWLGLTPPRLEPNTAHPLDLLPGALDEPLVLTADKNGTLRVVSNACTHRGMKLVCDPLSTNRLRCGYHGRRFKLDGRLPSECCSTSFRWMRFDMIREPVVDLKSMQTGSCTSTTTLRGFTSLPSTRV